MILYQFTLEIQDNCSAYEHTEFVLAQDDPMAARFAREFARHWRPNSTHDHELDIYSAPKGAAMDARAMQAHHSPDSPSRRQVVERACGTGSRNQGIAMNTVLALQTDSPGNGQMLVPVPLTLIEPTSWELEDMPATQMPIGSILISPNGDGKATDLDGLVASIRKRGVLQPLVVAPDGRLLAGRRRLEAARRAGLTTVPVRVCEIETERAAIEIGLIENVERADLDPLTRAKSYHALIEQGASVEEIANLVGQGTGHVYQHLQLLKLHPDVQQALHIRTLSFADARALVPLELEDQAAVLQEICASPKPLSSRQVKLRVDARRVMRLVRKDDPGTQGKAETLTDDSSPESDPNAKRVEGNYAALFAAEDATTSLAQPSSDSDPLDQLNTLIAEMVSAAQGEDQVRAWARRLSRTLEELGTMKAEATSKKKSASTVQDRLL